MIGASSKPPWKLCSAQGTPALGGRERCLKEGVLWLSVVYLRSAVGWRAALPAAPRSSADFEKPALLTDWARLGLFWWSAVFGLNRPSFPHSLTRRKRLMNFLGTCSRSLPPPGVYTPSPSLSPANSPLPWKS